MEFNEILRFADLTLLYRTGVMAQTLINFVEQKHFIQ